MTIKDQVTEMDTMVAQGAIVEAVDRFFADTARTSDYNELTTNNKQEMLVKMKTFTGAIAKVNGITHHRSIVDDFTSASEFTFDFEMKDGSHIYWHEMIRRLWHPNGQVIEEVYFDAK